MPKILKLERIFLRSLLFCLLLPLGAIGQIRIVDSLSKVGIPYATIHWKEKNTSQLTDSSGFFTPRFSTGTISIQSIGYEKTSIKFNNSIREISMIPKSFSTRIALIQDNQPKHDASAVPLEHYSIQELTANAPSNLTEVVGQINGIQSQITCGVCNTTEIRINGMDGPYSQILINGSPIVSGLGSVYGLTGIPSFLIKNIDVQRGAASTRFGSEAIAGAINIETGMIFGKKPYKINAQASTYGEFQFDVARAFNSKLSSHILALSGNWFNTLHDINRDNFTDIATQKRATYFYQGKSNFKHEQTITWYSRGILENRWGGQLNWNEHFRGSDSIYAESILTKRLEASATYIKRIKSGVFKTTASYAGHAQNSWYGIHRFKANQSIGFFQSEYQHNSRWNTLSLGIGFRYTQYADSTPVSLGTQKTFLPGFFVENNGKITQKLKWNGGIRIDHHPVHGLIFSPRAGLKLQINSKHSFLASWGSGFRVVSLFTEEHASLTGSRDIVILEKLNPERGNSYYLQYVGDFHTKHFSLDIDISLFTTRFTNRIYADYTSDDDCIFFSNLNGKSGTDGATTNAKLLFNNGLQLDLGGSVFNAYRTDRLANGTTLSLPVFYTPKYSYQGAITYPISNSKLSLNLNFRVTGPMRLPVQSNDFRPAYSPIFTQLNASISGNSKSISWKLGGRNLLNALPKNPILRPFDPFDKQANDPISNPNGYTFDTTYVYAAMQGFRLFFEITF